MPGIHNRQRLFRSAVSADLDAMYRTALRMLHDRDDAEDAVQETLQKAWRNLASFRSGSDMRPWLFRILSNTCIDILRARRPEAGIPLDEAPAEKHATATTPEDALADRDRAERLEAAISNLSAAHRGVVQLVIVEQFSYEEAAQALELPVGTIRSRLSRARAELVSALKDILEPAGSPHDRTRPHLKLVK